MILELTFSDMVRVSGADDDVLYWTPTLSCFVSKEHTSQLIKDSRSVIVNVNGLKCAYVMVMKLVIME